MDEDDAPEAQIPTPEMVRLVFEQVGEAKKKAAELYDSCPVENRTFTQLSFLEQFSLTMCQAFKGSKIKEKMRFEQLFSALKIIYPNINQANSNDAFKIEQETMEAWQDSD